MVTVVRDTSGLARVVMAGDRGMITGARVQALNRVPDGTQRPDGCGWFTALRAPAIKMVMVGDGPLQLRSQAGFAGTPAAVPVLAEPASAQREPFSLLSTPVPLTRK